MGEGGGGRAAGVGVAVNGDTGRSSGEALRASSEACGEGRGRELWELWESFGTQQGVSQLRAGGHKASSGLAVCGR